jgi:transcriptional regulator with XRE-family HTH domain
MQLEVQGCERRETGMFMPAQLRAARALAGWSREELAEMSGTSAETVKRFELQGSDPKRSTMMKWRSALAQVGVEFTDPTDEGKGEGVRFRTPRGRK